jgi:hypothetical protein
MKHLHSVFTTLLVALPLAWMAGCGDQSTPKKTSEKGATIAKGKVTPFEDSLTRWRAGDQAGAIQRFLEIDWKKSEPAFTPNAPLSLREKDLLTMSAAERERRVGEAWSNSGT